MRDIGSEKCDFGIRRCLRTGPCFIEHRLRSKSRMSGDAHVRICESLGVKFPRATRLVIVIRRKRYWLWRAVDNEGEVLDFLVQSRRDAKAAKKLMKKLLKKQGFAPSRIVTDKLGSYPSAFRAVGLVAEHDRGLRANNRAENSHLPVRRRERNSKSSSHLAPRNVSSASVPRPTTPSITSATSSNDPCTKNF